MRLASLAPVFAAIGLVLGAQALADAANARRATGTDAETAPYAPSPGAAPFSPCRLQRPAAWIIESSGPKSRCTTGKLKSTPASTNWVVTTMTGWLCRNNR